MQVSQSYGVARPAQIEARLAALRAHCFRAPIGAPEVEPEVAAIAPQTLPLPVAEVEAREPFVLTHPHLREVHLRGQRRMFAVIKSAGLSTALSARLDGANALLGTTITSSTHLSPDEMHAVADAIEAGRFTSNWELIADATPMPDAPLEIEAAPATVGTPAPLESLDELAMEFDLAQARAADRARALNEMRARRVLLQTQLIELDRAILCA